MRDDGAASALLHGDYRLDNVILDAGDPGRIAAIVDWEMAALGDPLADLGLLLVYWDPTRRASRSSAGATSPPPTRVSSPRGN
ncbi:phosphotransferase [Streptomyces sp. NPDC056462]|uniref:phosphotransferase n=1 Tax=Streptomyces sp. NPDC056462 TaxID=3345826 RepID=UPI0036A3043B